MPAIEPSSLRIADEADIVAARREVRRWAEGLGFSRADGTRIATAVSELARNVYKYAGEGRMTVAAVGDEGSRVGLRLTFVDEGPGIADVEQAMADGFSTSDGLGQGLPGSRRLMDEFRIESAPGRGTRVAMTKWQTP